MAKLRLEKAGRGGKSVTVVYDLPRNAAFLKDLCGELKRTCDTGGAVRDDAVEIQGDLRERVREVLSKKGYAIMAEWRGSCIILSWRYSHADLTKNRHALPNSGTP